MNCMLQNITLMNLQTFLNITLMNLWTFRYRNKTLPFCDKEYAIYIQRSVRLSDQYKTKEDSIYDTMNE